MSSYQLILVMPAYNEEGCIADVVRSWNNFLGKHFRNEPFLVLIVNDGSKDHTGQILDKLAQELKTLRVLHQKNAGHGAAVLNGYRQAIELGATWVFQTDSDAQFVADDFLKLWAQRSQSNFILGYRRNRHDPLHRLIITRFVRLVLFILFGRYLKDSNIPFRLMRADFLKSLLPYIQNDFFAPNIFLSVLAKLKGQNLFDIPVTHIERQTGVVSIVRWKLIKVCFKSLAQIAKFRWQLLWQN